MPSNQTPNYALSQWERDDRILMDDFNADNAKIDTALKAETDARTAADAILTAAVSKLGNCQIEVTSYVGTGTSDSRIAFQSMPVFFILAGGPGCVIGFGGTVRPYYIGTRSEGANGGSVVSASGFTASWSGNRMTIVSDSVAERLNQKDKLYQIISFYMMDKT